MRMAMATRQANPAAAATTTVVGGSGGGVQGSDERHRHALVAALLPLDGLNGPLDGLDEPVLGF